MPGFFMTFMLLAGAAAWCRYVAATKGPAWLIWVPGPGTLLWLLTFVYAIASMSAGDSTTQLADAEAQRLALEATAERLSRVRMAAGVGQWSGILTVVVSVALTGWAFLRTPPTAENAG